MLSDLPMNRFPGIGFGSVREPMREMAEAAALKALAPIQNPGLAPESIAVPDCEFFTRRTTIWS